MPVDVTCVRCEKQFPAPDDADGALAKCPHCGYQYGKQPLRFKPDSGNRQRIGGGCLCVMLGAVLGGVLGWYGVTWWLGPMPHDRMGYGALGYLIYQALAALGGAVIAGGIGWLIADAATPPSK